jgi:hypothetical protein
MIWLAIAGMTMKYPLHSCPVCGRPIGAKRWFWRAWIWARWHCVSCGTLLRFDFRRRLMVGLFVGLFHALMMGVAVLCMMSPISAWVWASALFVIYIAGTIFTFVHGDRIIVADQRKADPVALTNDA